MGVTLENAEGPILLLASSLIAIISSISLNLLTERLWRGCSSMTYWIVNVGAVPTLLVSYGLYAFLTYVPVDCYSTEGFGFLCVEPEVAKFGIAFMWILILPLIFVCFAIPLTMWFAKSRVNR